MHLLHSLWQSQSWQWGAHPPGLPLTLGRWVRKFSFLTLLTKKPYFLNVFAGANLRAPSCVLPIPTRLPTLPLLHGCVLRQSELGPGPAGFPGGSFL